MTTPSSAPAAGILGLQAGEDVNRTPEDLARENAANIERTRREAERQTEIARRAAEAAEAHRVRAAEEAKLAAADAAMRSREAAEAAARRHADMLDAIRRTNVQARKAAEKREQLSALATYAQLAGTPLERQYGIATIGDLERYEELVRREVADAREARRHAAFQAAVLHNQSWLDGRASAAECAALDLPPDATRRDVIRTRYAQSRREQGVLSFDGARAQAEAAQFTSTTVFRRWWAHAYPLRFSVVSAMLVAALDVRWASWDGKPSLIATLLGWVLGFIGTPRSLGELAGMSWAGKTGTWLGVLALFALWVAQATAGPSAATLVLIALPVLALMDLRRAFGTAHTQSEALLAARREQIRKTKANCVPGWRSYLRFVAYRAGEDIPEATLTARAEAAAQKGPCTELYPSISDAIRMLRFGPLHPTEYAVYEAAFGSLSQIDETPADWPAPQ